MSFTYCRLCDKEIESSVFEFHYSTERTRLLEEKFNSLIDILAPTLPDYNSVKNILKLKE